MNYWTGLSVTAAVLTFLFWLVRRKGRKPKWLLPVVLVFCALAMMSEVVIRFFHARSHSNSVTQAEERSVKQETTGDQSPAVSAEGDVTIRYGDQQNKDQDPEAGTSSNEGVK